MTDCKQYHPSSRTYNGKLLIDLNSRPYHTRIAISQTVAHQRMNFNSHVWHFTQESTQAQHCLPTHNFSAVHHMAKKVIFSISQQKLSICFWHMHTSLTATIQVNLDYLVANLNYFPPLFPNLCILVYSHPSQQYPVMSPLGIPYISLPLLPSTEWYKKVEHIAHINICSIRISSV